jgi:hypothetical protein
MKKKLIYIIVLLIWGSGNIADAQQMLVTDDPSYTMPAEGAMLDVKSTTKGLIVPRMTTEQRTTLGLTIPVNGVVVYDTDQSSFWYWETDEWRQIAASGLNLNDIKFGDASNYSTFESNGTLLMVGDATVWDDVRISIMLRGSGGTSPVFTQIQGNLYAYKFSGTALNEIFFEVQMPHAWNEGTTIYPHVHWVSNGTATSAVTWGLDYEWANLYDTFSGTTSNISASTPAIGNKTHNITDLSASGITESDKRISSMIMCRLYREGNTDANNDDCFLLAFDIHYEVNTLGSRSLLVK